MKKTRLYILLLALVAVAAVLVVVFRREREPEYGGKKLSEWVERRLLSWHRQSLVTARFPGEPDDPRLVRRINQQAAEAMQPIGTNAIPYLIAWMQYKPPAWKTKALITINRTFHSHFVDHKALRAEGALDALTFLGERGESAVRQLAALIKDGTSPEKVERAETVLVALGQKLLSADMALMTNTLDNWSRPRPILLAIVNAGALGTNAKPAIPVLLGLLRDGDVFVRLEAAEALEKIDPKALESATR